MMPTAASHDQARNRFCHKLKQKDPKAKLHTLKTTYAVDTSGSTAGHILQSEQLSISMMEEFLSCARLISWNSSAYVVPGANLHILRATGCTEPATFVPLLEKDCQLLVLHTDGQITSISMNRFSNAMDARQSKFPIIIVFTLAPFLCDPRTTVLRIERQVNMSIPETCIAFSEDVLILVNSDGAHRTMMSKGIFSFFGQPNLDKDTLIQDLPACNLHDLKMLRTQDALPPGFIRLPGWTDPVSLEAVYRANVSDEDTVKDLLPVLEKLCQRIYLPNLDLDQLHPLLASLSRKLTENPELRKIQDELARIAVGDLAGTDQHKSLIEKLQAIRAAKSAPEAIARNSMINRFLSMIAEYRAGSTSFVLGSNRATGAAVIQDEAFQDRGQCLQMECPIMLTQQDACLLLTAPSKEDFEKSLAAGAQDLKSKDLEFLATTDLAMEAPFWCGWALRSCVTPNLVGFDFAESASRHPFTGQEIIGYIPLSQDPAVVMRFMSRIFGHSKELWHLVRAYIAMVAYNLEREWCDPLLKDHLNVLFDNYHATIDLRGGTEKVPLRQAFANCLDHYATCLRNRYPPDIRAIIHISKHILPDHAFDETKITGMVQVLETFQQLLRQHKDRQSMMRHVMDVDDWGHFQSQRTDLTALVGYIFWKQDCEGKNDYRNLKLQIAIDTILSQDALGKELLKAFHGQPSFSIPPVALPEPHGDHFTLPAKYESWSKDGRPKDCCVYCGYRFQLVTASNGFTYSDRRVHLQHAFGTHYYNGQAKVLEAIQQLPRTATDKEIFQLTKQKLFRQYGEMAGFLHTQRCKRILTWMITHLLEEMDKD